jgi:DNA-binding NarL/FixJ family response regulator
MAPRTIRVAFVDDHQIVLEGLVGYLRGSMPDLRLVDTATTVSGLTVGRGEADVCVLDVELRDGTDAEQNVESLVALGAGVLLFTQVTSARVMQRCVRAGAAGIVGKGEDNSVLVDAIRRVAEGEPWFSADWAQALNSDKDWVPHLSPREAEVLRMHATGLPMKNVARALGVSTETVRTQLSRVRDKYAQAGREARTRSELLVRAVEDGLVEPPGTGR